MDNSFTSEIEFSEEELSTMKKIDSLGVLCKNKGDIPHRVGRNY